MRQRDPGDLVGAALGHPDGAAWAGGDAVRVGSGRRQRKLGHVATGIKPADQAALLAEPDSAVGRYGQVAEPAERRAVREQREPAR
jgi:hypothetical protein